MSTTGEKQTTTTKKKLLKINNTLVSNQKITEEIQKEIKICTETTEYESTRTQNL